MVDTLQTFVLHFTLSAKIILPDSASEKGQKQFCKTITQGGVEFVQRNEESLFDEMKKVGCRGEV